MMELERLIDRAHETHGVAWHVNCHSMRSAGRKRGQSIPRADIVLGDRDGTSCGADFTSFVAEIARGLGYQVALNDPFKGAELVARFGRPEDGRHSLQIEINRALYMDEDRIEKRADFAAFKQDMDRLIGAIADYVRDRNSITVSRDSQIFSPRHHHRQAIIAVLLQAVKAIVPTVHARRCRYGPVVDVDGADPVFGPTPSWWSRSGRAWLHSRRTRWPCT